MLEEIVLKSNDGSASHFTPPPSDTRRVNQELRCKLKNKGVSIRLFNSFYVEQVFDTPQKNTLSDIALHCGFLNSKPHTLFHIRRVFLSLSLLSFALCAVFLTLAPGMFSETIRYALAGISFVFAAFTFFLFAKDFYLVTTFVSATAEAPLIRIPHKSCTSRKRKAFVHALSHAIETNPLPRDINPKAEEMKLLRGFAEKKWIKKAKYEQYREKIMQSYSK